MVVIDKFGARFLVTSGNFNFRRFDGLESLDAARDPGFPPKARVLRRMQQLRLSVSNRYQLRYAICADDLCRRQTAFSLSLP